MTKDVKQTFKENGQLANPSETFDKDGNLTFSDQGRPYRDENGVLTTTTYCEGQIVEPKTQVTTDENGVTTKTTRENSHSFGGSAEYYRKDGSLESKATYYEGSITPEPGGR